MEEYVGINQFFKDVLKILLGGIEMHIRGWKLSIINQTIL